MIDEKNYKIMVVDDEMNIKRLISYNLEKLGYKIITASDGLEAKEKINNEALDIIILDINMPNLDGIEVLKYVESNFVSLPVIMITASNEVAQAVECMKLGAFDYLTKPIDIVRLRATIKNALEVHALKHEVKDLKKEIIKNSFNHGIYGVSEKIKNVLEQVERVAGTDLNVLILGESGSGKELISKAVHLASKRRNGAFIPVNCAAITQELSDSLFFGHKKGSFTGATEDRIGFFEQANGGTLFLDEIAEMNIELQAKILRVIEERVIRRVGEKEERKVDFRLISATNRDFSNSITKSEFRSDLFYRLEEFPILVPPLRERVEDIPILADYFLENFCTENGVERKYFLAETVESLKKHNWPGNIRELKNTIRRSAINCNNSHIENIMFSMVQNSSTPQQTIVEKEDQNFSSELEVNKVNSESSSPSVKNYNLDDIEKQTIYNAFLKTNGNVSEAAKVLGISRATIYRKMEKFGLIPKS